LRAQVNSERRKTHRRITLSMATITRHRGVCVICRRAVSRIRLVCKRKLLGPQMCFFFCLFLFFFSFFLAQSAVRLTVIQLGQLQTDSICIAKCKCIGQNEIPQSGLHSANYFCPFILWHWFGFCHANGISHSYAQFTQ